ncbi:MAG: hypothetical protein FRX49_06845 [Trebouxia sp. A1-2]|nr:MAG: hypothetical protein FRX49_06845 [Trebouxia sp. A1-2]
MPSGRPPPLPELTLILSTLKELKEPETALEAWLAPSCCKEGGSCCLPNNDPSAILYCPALTAAIDDEMSGAPLPKARKVTACTTVGFLYSVSLLQDAL